MRILYIGTSLPHVRRFLKKFSDLDHEIHLITWDNFYFEGVKIHYLGGNNPHFRKWSIFPTAVYVKSLINKIKPDIIHSHYLLPNSFYASFSGFHPHIASAWGSDVYCAPKKFFLAKMVRYALDKSDVILTTSMQLKKDIVSLGLASPDKKIIQLDWGINTKQFSKKNSIEAKKIKEYFGLGGKFIVLNPRGLRSITGYPQSIKALSKIVKYHPDVVLVLLKGLPDENKSMVHEINSLIKKHNLEKNILYLREKLSQDEMSDLYNISDVLISIPPSDQFSGCVQEGMACGVIPVVSRLKVYEQYLKDGKNAFFVSRDNPDEIADKILYCARNPDLKERFYKINRKIIEENKDWNKNSKKIMALYEEMIKK